MELQPQKMTFIYSRINKLLDFVAVRLEKSILISKSNAVLHVIVVHIQVIIAKNKNILVIPDAFSVESRL